MNQAIEDLSAERQVVKSAVERFSPITVAWAFEAEPASPKPLLDFYLDAVKTCDAFVLIVGQNLTKPVQNEVQVALDYRKPMLAFCKRVAQRDPEAQDLLQAMDVKYDLFANAVELHEMIRQSLGGHLLGIVRGQLALEVQLGDRLAQLRGFARQHRVVSIFPTIPICRYNSFTVEEVNHNHVRFQKNGFANVYVPAERIAAVLETGSHERPSIEVEGRLQWITARQNWYFRPEKPPSPDPWGIGVGRQAPREPQFSEETLSLLQAHPCQIEWSNPESLAGREVFFDEDGKHLANGRQILTCTR